MGFPFQFRVFKERLLRPLQTGRAVFREREGILLRAENGETVRFAEAVCLPGFCENTTTDMAAVLEGIGSLDARVFDKVPPGMGSLRFALGCLLTEGEKLPHGGMEVAALLRGDGEELAELAVRGFRVFKLKIGIAEREAELARVDAVLENLPDGGLLRLDANGSLSRRDAEWWLGRLEGRSEIEFLEQPLAADDGEGLAGLSKNFRTPIALDESVAGDGDLSRWLDAGWRGVFVLKLSLHGDAAGALRLVSDAGAEVVFSSALESLVGARTVLGLALDWGDKLPSRRALGFGVWPLFERSVFDAPLKGAFLRGEDLELFNLEAAWNALG